MPSGAITALIIIAALIVIILVAGYVKAPPDIAYIISGLKKEPKVLIGRAGIKIPFLERKDTLLLKQISIDIKTGGYVPTKDFIGVDIDAVAKVKVDTSEEGILKAQRNFLNMPERQFVEALTDSLQGNLREIIGTIELRELNTDRKKFGDEVQEKAQVDMKSLGIQIISCNIQRIEDEKGLINALGQDNMSKIQKDASIAKANADRDVAVAQAEAAKESHENVEEPAKSETSSEVKDTKETKSENPELAEQPGGNASEEGSELVPEGPENMN
jgi:flotillin